MSGGGSAHAAAAVAAASSANNNTMYRIGDYVYFENSSSASYAIRRIEELNRSGTGNVEARVSTRLCLEFEIFLIKNYHRLMNYTQFDFYRTTPYLD